MLLFYIVGIARFIDNVRYASIRLAIRLAISVRHTRAVEGECG